MFDKYLTKTGLLSKSQPQDIKNQWYIQKFQEVHGNRYDYSKVAYKTAREKIVIICKEHGEFLQTPQNHQAGKGCPSCQGNRKKVSVNCIQEFICVHGETYDYSNTVYINNCTKVEIICKEHGSFFQTPNNHLRGHGCPKCQVSNQNTLYILKCLDTGLIKIGITNSLDKRISKIGGNLEYLHHITLENPRQLELELHERYRQLREFNPNVKNGGTEFFRLSEQQVKDLIEELQK